MSIFLTKQFEPVNFVWFDTFDNWNVQRSKTMTKHPVIPNPEVTDHVQVHNVQVSFRGYVGTPGGVVPGVGVERMKLFLDTIGASLVTVTSPFGVFANMVVTAHETEQRGSLIVDCTAEQVRIATIAEVPIPPRVPNPAASAQQASSQDAGAASAASSGASLASSAVDAAQGVLDSLFGS